jgi:Uma2 family endonuclease
MTGGGPPARMIADAELQFSQRAEQIMVMPALRKRRWTIEEVERLIDQRDGYTPRYELVDGELLVTPAPSGRHQRIVGSLYLLVRAYVTRHRLGEVSFGPGKIDLPAEAYFEPDIFVILSADGRLPKASDPVTHPLLLGEVLSPGSSRHDRVTKRRAFQDHEVPTYWVVDGDAEVFEIWHPGDARAMVADDRLTWWPAGASAPFELDVKRFFASVADGAPLPE